MDWMRNRDVSVDSDGVVPGKSPSADLDNDFKEIDQMLPRHDLLLGVGLMNHGYESLKNHFAFLFPFISVTDGILKIFVT